MELLASHRVLAIDVFVLQWRVVHFCGNPIRVSSQPPRHVSISEESRAYGETNRGPEPLDVFKQSGDMGQLNHSKQHRG